MSQNYHPYHLVDPSPWPFVGSMSVFGVAVGTAMYFHRYANGEKLLLLSVTLLILVLYVWFRDVIREGTYLGAHTLVVQKGLRLGMIFFIVSEVCLFISLFWAFFHSALVPTIELGNQWPPVGIVTFDAFGVPLLNTAILLASGAFATWAHNAMISGNRQDTLLGLGITVFLGLIFTALQGYEYYEASFTIADSVYGSCFFICTGAHGLHVIMGTIILIVSLFRIYQYQMTRHHHNGFEAALAYWHFVDVVWLFLYVSIYWWGGA